MKESDQRPLRSVKVRAGGADTDGGPRATLAEWRHWALWFVAVFPVCWRQITTSDCWWHVALGRWLAQRGSLPDYAQFYFTPLKGNVTDLRWTALGDLILYFAHEIGGPFALQVLSFGCVAGGCVLLRRLRAGAMNGWVTVLLVTVALGTYQLQLPRNAVFSLPLTALVFWLVGRFRATRRARFAWLLPVVVGVWSFVHASCLLGWVLVALLLGLDAVEGVRENWGTLWVRLRFVVPVVGIALIGVTAGNPPAIKMLRRPVAYVFNSQPPAKKKVVPTMVVAEPTAEVPRGVKEWLNNVIWPTKSGQVRSADFSSPLDRLSYRPVALAFALMALAGAWPLWTRAPSFPWIAAYAATALLGLSYFRMTGYAALGSAALILSCGPLRGRVGVALGKSGWLGTALVGLMAAVFWGSWLSGDLARVIGNSRHVMAVGKVSTFDDEATQWLLEHHRDRRVFTTIVTGSYALHRWQWQKPVFIDGFFAPHADSLWKDYVRARQESDRDVLREKYGVDLALVEHTRLDWNGVFLNQPGWQPAAIGPGCNIYAHISVLRDAPPELLLTPEEAEKMPAYFRSALARNYYQAILSMLAADRISTAKAFVDHAPEAYLRWREWASPAEKDAIGEMDPILRPKPVR